MNPKITIAINEIAAKVNPEAERPEIEHLLQREFSKLLRNKAMAEVAVLDYFLKSELPNDSDLEASVISRLLTNPTKINLCGDITLGHFYNPNHTAVWLAISQLTNDNKPISLDTVLNVLGNAGIAFDRLYIEALPNISYTDYSDESKEEFQALTEELGKYALLRNMYRMSAEYLPKILNAPSALAMTLRYEMENIIKSASNLVGSLERYADGAQLGEESVAAMEQRIANKINGIPLGYSTCLSDITKYTGGWQRKTTTIIAGRPGQGKTSFVLGDILTAIKLGEVVVMFTLEMSRLRLIDKLFSIEYEISYERIIKGELEEQELQLHRQFCKWIATTGLHIDDTREVDTNYVAATCHKIKLKKGQLNRIYADYLQLFSHVDKRLSSKPMDVATQVSKSMNIIAGQFDVPVILVSQLSRAVETRGGDKRPILSDLRDSGQIEQDADSVIFIYRPEYYKITEDENGRDLRGIVEVIFAKHRDGEPRTVEAYFEARYTKFKNLEERPAFFEENNQQDFLPAPVINVDEIEF